MGKIADILNSKEFPNIDLVNELKDIFAAPDKLLGPIDYEDLKAAVKRGSPSYIRIICTGLKNQTPKVVIPEEIIAKAIGNFVIQAEELKAVQELTETVLVTGGDVSVSTLKDIINKPFVTQRKLMMDTVTEAIIKSNKEQVADVVELYFNYLDASHGRDIPGQKTKLIDSYLATTGGKVDDKVRVLAKASGIDIDAKAKGMSYGKQPVAPSFHKKPAAVKVKATEKPAAAEEPKPGPPKPNTW